MRIAGFYHSLISDWNHGNAHFLRGIASELIARGHDFQACEPEDAWSLQNLIRDHGTGPIRDFESRFPQLKTTRYDLRSLRLDDMLEGADLVLVHEWNDPELVARIGGHHRRNPGYVLLFHDTHHRSVTAPESMAVYDLSGFDGVLAYGEAIRRIYVERGWARQAWTWHEAADVRTFHPLDGRETAGDLVWIGNWGDEERTAELEEFLIEPVRALGLRAKMYGVRYPEHALARLRESGIEYGGWVANYEVPSVLAQYHVTVHIPRSPYVTALSGIPTIRPFEALACGIPLISAPWEDSESLFTVGEDFLMASDGSDLKRKLRTVLDDPALVRALSEHGHRTILARHTCGHRVDQLLSIYESLAISMSREFAVEQA